VKNLILLILFLSNSSVYAQKISVGVGTELPLGVSADVIIQPTDFNFYFRGQAGMFLSSYTDAMNSTAESFDFYNSATSEIIAASLENAPFWQINLGWAPNPAEGIYAEFSYLSVQGQGQVTGATILEAISNTSLPAGSNYYDIEGKVQTLGINLGYKWQIKEGSTILLSGGVLKPIQSNTEISRDVTGPVQRALLDAANRELDAYMKESLENDVYIPVIALHWLTQI
jgi:hypothetical protein